MNAFTDGVVAILITILVLELRPPAGHQLSDILHEKSRLLAYVLSFVFVAIYWVNHHHLMQVVHRIDGRTLWTNIHLLFWLSLTPIATDWLGEAGVHEGPVAVYAIVLLGCAFAYTFLNLSRLPIHEPGSQLHRGDRQRQKGQSLRRPLCRGFRVRLRGPMGLGGAVRHRRLDLVHPRPQDRAGARRAELAHETRITKLRDS